MKQPPLLSTVMMLIFLITGSLYAADQSEDLFLNVQQITFLKKDASRKNLIVINDPGKVKQMVDMLHLAKSERQVTFIKARGKVETNVCKHCVEIRDKKERHRFQTPTEFYELVKQVTERQ